MLLKITPVIFVVIISVACQENATEVIDTQNITALEDVKVETDIATMLPPNETPLNPAPPATHEEQADQPAAEVTVQPTRLPSPPSEVSTFPPLVHTNTSSENPTTMDVNTTVSKAPVTTKTPTEAPKTPSAKNPEDRKTEATTVPNKDGKKGGAAFCRENFVLIVLGASVLLTYLY